MDNTDLLYCSDLLEKCMDTHLKESNVPKDIARNFRKLMEHYICSRLTDLKQAVSQYGAAVRSSLESCSGERQMQSELKHVKEKLHTSQYAGNYHLDSLDKRCIDRQLTGM